jgi:hypothetical protein
LRKREDAVVAQGVVTDKVEDVQRVGVKRRL